MSERFDQQQCDHMRHALALARRGEGRTSPNPPVGAVLARDSRVVGQGFHPCSGEPHAEVFALREAGTAARGATLYVTLEPCCHFGKTPPCVDAIIAAGVAQVVVGVIDPNPRVAGQGIERLRRAGIEVMVGCLEQECRRLIAGFARLLLDGRPYTIYKTAMTVDGQTATHRGDARWVSGTASRLRVHRLRDRVEAIMVGIETVLKDDPLLTARLPEGNGHDPLRVIVDSRLRMPLNCRMLRQQSAAETLIATCSEDQKRHRALEQAGAKIVHLPAESGRISLVELWRELGRHQVQRVLLEGGPTLAAAALQAGLIDRLMLFVAPRLIGGQSGYGVFSGTGCEWMNEALHLEDVSYEQVADDLLVSGDVPRCSPA